MSSKTKIREKVKKLNPIDDCNSKFPITSGIKRRYKETEEGQKVICEIMEKMLKKNKTKAG